MSDYYDEHVYFAYYAAKTVVARLRWKEHQSELRCRHWSILSTVHRDLLNGSINPARSRLALAYPLRILSGLKPFIYGNKGCRLHVSGLGPK